MLVGGGVNPHGGLICLHQLIRVEVRGLRVVVVVVVAAVLSGNGAVGGVGVLVVQAPDQEDDLLEALQGERVGELVPVLVEQLDLV